MPLRLALCCVLALAAPAALAQAPPAFPNLPAFERPTDLNYLPGFTNRLVVSEQGGRLWIFSNTPGVSQRQLFLDLRSRVFEASAEGGLLSFAFPPDFSIKPFLYVYYVAGDPSNPNGTRRKVVARYHVPASTGLPDPATETIMIEIPAPGPNLHGGKIVIGPDGHLYIPTGDGGTIPGQSAAAQDLTTFHGKVLRLDVDNPSGGRNYGIPPDNPLVGNPHGWREEIWAWGLRNPWRSSFDAQGRLWTGDVGDHAWEEVDILARGENYGWPIMEANTCLETPCNPALYERPVWAYAHGTTTGYSITGGYVYRGTQAPALAGRYVFGDFVTGRVWTLNANNPSSPDVRELGQIVPNFEGLVGFGESEEGELFALGFSGGRVYSVTAWAATAAEPTPGLPGNAALRLAGPNPFAEQTTLTFTPEQSGPARVAAYDGLGREVAVLFEGTAVAGVQHRLEVDGRALAVGVYVVRMESEAGASYQRIVRTR
ncbi:MAG TPA: PQQ-dependent sugar dehydrogenase [Rubricoccaceae bacterium]|nr:PQQ-dependent sugar dehydrogenase [Rubricoccaceae bacterium]